MKWLTLLFEFIKNSPAIIRLVGELLKLIKSAADSKEPTSQVLRQSQSRMNEMRNANMRL